MIDDSSDPPCANSGIPEAYWQKDGQGVQTVDLSEFVFHRIDSSIPIFDEDQAINPAIFKMLKNMSVTRSGDLAAPEFAALYDGQKFSHKVDWSVVRMSVLRINAFDERLDTSPYHRYRATVKHRPYKCLHPHCEISITRIEKGGATVEDAGISERGSSLLKDFYAQQCECALVIQNGLKTN